MPAARWLAIGLVLGCATARADLITPTLRNVRPRMSFAGVQDHADHVFLVHVRDKEYWGPNVPFESRVIPIPGPQPRDPEPGPIRYRVAFAAGKLSVEPEPGDRDSSAATIAIETVVLAVLLSPRHDWRVRLFAGVWLIRLPLDPRAHEQPDLVHRGGVAHAP